MAFPQEHEEQRAEDERRGLGARGTPCRFSAGSIVEPESKVKTVLEIALLLPGRLVVPT